jgi:EAL and modified HD-GYP domain-containing signal transduction protein
MKGRKIPGNRIGHLQILELLQHRPLDLLELSELVKQDTSLAYRFLRLVNSPIAAMRQEVRSIRSALVLLGDDAVRRIATLAIVSEFNAEQPAEILRMAFVRARFCEQGAGLCALEQSEQYLLGLFSLLAAMLRKPMEELALALPLRKKIRGALLGTECLEGSLLRWSECHERGDWAQCDAIAEFYRLNQNELMRRYGEAVAWTEATLHFAA